jgi:REP element-mobilizing transposase RayT
MPPRNPIVIAYHLVWTAYGTWLPNDPRGSGSHHVATPTLAELGELHFGRRPVQPPPRVVREFYRRAEPRLIHPVIRFDARQIEVIAAAFAEEIHAKRYTCYACAILSDHAHLVIRKHKHRAEAMIENLQRASRLRLSREVEIPPDHPVWTEGGWKSVLDSPEAVRATARYVQRNPIKADLPAQSWNFVTPYEGWSFRSRSPLVD